MDIKVSEVLAALRVVESFMAEHIESANQKIAELEKLGHPDAAETRLHAEKQAAALNEFRSGFSVFLQERSNLNHLGHLRWIAKQFGAAEDATARPSG